MWETNDKILILITAMEANNDDVKLELDWHCGFDPELDPNFDDNHVVSWEEHAAEALHIVRLHQITEYDPVRRMPVRTRFCKFNLAYFDFDKQ